MAYNYRASDASLLYKASDCGKGLDSGNIKKQHRNTIVNTDGPLVWIGPLSGNCIKIIEWPWIGSVYGIMVTLLLVLKPKSLKANNSPEHPTRLD